MSNQVYTEADKTRALDVYATHGYSAALAAGPWSSTRLVRWVQDAKAAGLVTKPPNQRKVNPDRDRAIDLYRTVGYSTALETGGWSPSTFSAWIRWARTTGKLPPAHTQTAEPVPTTPEKPRPVFPDLGPIPKRPFDPDEVCRSQARAQLRYLT